MKLSLRAAALFATAFLGAGCSVETNDAEGTATQTTQALTKGTAVACPTHPPKVEDGKLMVFDESKGAYAEYFVKGMAYSPEPSSFAWDLKTSNAKPGAAGTLCRWESVGGYGFSSCFDSDYAGNLVSFDRTRVANADFRANWLRDMRAMKELGVNTIRLYNANPQFRDHKAFLDDAHAHGMKVMFPAWYLPHQKTNYPFEAGTPGPSLPVQDGVAMQLAEVASHPAVLLWTVGNELVSTTDYRTLQGADEKITQNINRVIDQIKGECGGQLLVANVPQDLGDEPASWKSWASAFPKQDLFVVNAGYRGHPKDGGYAKLFDVVKDVTTTHDKPLVLGETGEYDDQNLGSDWFEALVRDIRANGSAKIAGATFFEYSDEPIAKSNYGLEPNSNQKHMGVVRLEADASNKAVDRVIEKQDRFAMVKRAFRA